MTPDQLEKTDLRAFRGKVSEQDLKPFIKSQNDFSRDPQAKYSATQLDGILEKHLQDLGQSSKFDNGNRKMTAYGANLKFQLSQAMESYKVTKGKVPDRNELNQMIYSLTFDTNAQKNDGDIDPNSTTLKLLGKDGRVGDIAQYRQIAEDLRLEGEQNTTTRMLIENAGKTLLAADPNLAKYGNEDKITAVVNQINRAGGRVTPQNLVQTLLAK
jgi:hypothetical protein